MDGENKVAVVTGGGSGIGRAAAIALAKDGFALVLGGRRMAPLESVASEIASVGGDAWPIACDVGQEADVRRLFAAARQHFGRVDFLFNNAGISPPRHSISDVPLEEWNAAVAVNLTGVFLCTREAFAAMRDQRPCGGRIVNNGSISAHVPRPGSLAYTATKHAVTGITRATALEGRPYQIACGQIDIGNAATALTADLSSGREQADGEWRSEATMDVDQAGRAVAYMASLPLDANVLFMTIMATAMPYVGRG